MDILVPVLAVEICHGHRGDGSRVETVDVNADAFRVRARHVKRFDATVPAKSVLRDTRIESVSFQIGLAADQAKIFLRHNQVQVAGLAADAAIAAVRFNIRGRVDFEPNPTAVTTSPMSDH